MLAVKLHKKKNPFLGNKSYLIPILSWETGNVYIRNWIKFLNAHNENRPNNNINYITLVRIPNNHPVDLFNDWCHGWPDEWPKWSEIPQDEKRNIFIWHEKNSVYKIPESNHEKVEYGVWGFDMSEFFPELVIAQGLPRYSVLWTKSIHLLYYGNKMKNSKKNESADANSRAAD